MKNLSEKEFQDLAQANAALGEVERIDDDSIDLHIVLRPPGRLEWKQYRADAGSNPAGIYDIQWKLIDALLLHPTKQEFEQYLERRPAAVTTIFGEVNEIAGISTKAVRKKATRA